MFFLRAEVDVLFNWICKELGLLLGDQTAGLRLLDGLACDAVVEMVSVRLEATVSPLVEGLVIEGVAP